MNDRAERLIDDSLDWTLDLPRQLVESSLSEVERVQTPGAVHDARVALRRMRVLLRALEPHWHPRACRRALRPLSRLCAHLGPLREADVDLEICTRLLAEPPRMAARQRRNIEELVKGARESARRGLVREMDSPRWRLTRLRCQRTLERLSNKSGAQAFTHAMLAAQWGRLRKRLRRKETRIERLHRLRLEVKATRYLLDQLNISVSRSLAARLAALQAALGELNDLAILERTLAECELERSTSTGMRLRLERYRTERLSEAISGRRALRAELRA